MGQHLWNGREGVKKNRQKEKLGWMDSPCRPLLTLQEALKPGGLLSCSKLGEKVEPPADESLFEGSPRKGASLGQLEE